MSLKINVYFLEKLVKIHDAVNGITSPIADAKKLERDVFKAIYSGMDKAMFEACGNEVFKFRYTVCRAIKDNILKSTWNDRNLSDWMYYFGKQIWSRNAQKGTFGPNKFSDESAEEFTKRRSLGAKNTIPKVDKLLELLFACSEALAAMVISKEAASTIGGAQSALDRTSLGAACGILADRTSTIARGQVKRVDKMINMLSQLYRELNSIADESK